MEDNKENDSKEVPFKDHVKSMIKENLHEYLAANVSLIDVRDERDLMLDIISYCFEMENAECFKIVLMEIGKREAKKLTQEILEMCFDALDGREITRTYLEMGYYDEDVVDVQRLTLKSKISFVFRTLHNKGYDSKALIIESYISKHMPKFDDASAPSKERMGYRLTRKMFVPEYLKYLIGGEGNHKFVKYFCEQMTLQSGVWKDTPKEQVEAVCKELKENLVQYLY
jgi:hypothetical protein